jgi:predicted dehydrogenase
MKTYRSAVIGCGRMGAFIDNEVVGYPAVTFPYSHAAGFMACERTEIVACCDVREDVMEEFGKRYGVPKERHYTDYKALIDKERLDIVSVATQPEQRAEIVIYAVEHGVRAIYAEKALCASLEEADAIVEAVERNGAVLNMGTNRRWDPGYDKMKEIIESGELGALRSIIIYNNGSLFNTSSHTFDLAMRLNNDEPADWVQAQVLAGQDFIEGDVLKVDPAAQGTIQFRNKVTAYTLLTPRGDYEAICEKGTVTALNNGIHWQLRRTAPMDPGGRWNGLVTGTFPEFERASSTLRLIEDLVHSLDTGEPPRGGVRVAKANMELIFGFIESHRRGGARVSLPLENRKLKLQRSFSANTPRYKA